MAEEIFGDVPLNVVVKDLAKLLDNDIERVNKWIRIKLVFLIAVIAFAIINDIFLEVWALLLFLYGITLVILTHKVNGRHFNKISYCIVILKMRQLETNSLNMKLSLIRFILVHFGYAIIQEFPETERVDVLVKVTRGHYWMKQAFLLVPDFSSLF